MTTEALSGFRSYGIDINYYVKYIILIVLYYLFTFIIN